MTTHFDTVEIDLRWRPGADWLLPNGFEFWFRGHKFRHRPGGHTDGLSSPQFLHALPDADPWGWAAPAAVPHDGGYHDDLELQLDDGIWKKFTLNKDDCDWMFNELLAVLAGDVQEKKDEAVLFYEAVHLGGQAAFDAGRKACAAV